MLHRAWRDTTAYEMPLGEIRRIKCITKHQKAIKGMKFCDLQNEIEREISTEVMHEPTENSVLGDPSEVVQLDTQLDPNEDTEDSITIQDEECSDPESDVDNALADEDADGGHEDNMSSGEKVVGVENRADEI